jgi:hypothetical protein
MTLHTLHLAPGFFWKLSTPWMMHPTDADADAGVYTRAHREHWKSGTSFFYQVIARVAAESFKRIR